MLTHDTKGDFSILEDEHGVYLQHIGGARVLVQQALDDFKVGDARLTFELSVWINQSICQMMANKGLIDPDPTTWV
jgi:hypothetical protein